MKPDHETKAFSKYIIKDVHKEFEMEFFAVLLAVKRFDFQFLSHPSSVNNQGIFI